MERRHTPRAGWAAGGLVAMALAMVMASAMVLAGAHLWPRASANAMSAQALVQVRSWQAPRAKPPDIPTWLQTRSDLARALSRHPTDADLHEAMAYLYLLAAGRPDQGPLLSATYLRQALSHLRQATATRPMVPTAWANTALAIHQLAALEPTPEQSSRWLPALWAALERALVFGQRSQGVQQSTGAVAFSRWTELGPQRQQMVRNMVANATPAQQRALRALASSHRVNLEP